ncbi:MAG: hypothetical protein WCY59_03615, partial [Anaerovoracaceae bacterium]
MFVSTPRKKSFHGVEDCSCFFHGVEDLFPPGGSFISTVWKIVVVFSMVWKIYFHAVEDFVIVFHGVGDFFPWCGRFFSVVWRIS